MAAPIRDLWALPTWNDLFADPSLFDRLPSEAQATLYEQIAAMQAKLLAKTIINARSTAQQSSSEPDRALGIGEAARRLNTSKDSLYRIWRRLPFAYKDPIDGKVKFSGKGIERHISQRAGSRRDC